MKTNKHEISAALKAKLPSALRTAQRILQQLSKNDASELAGGLNRRRRRQRLLLNRFRRPAFRSGQSLGGRSLLLGFLDQATHRVGRLGSFADPVLDPFNVQRAIMTWDFRIVRADDLDKFPLAWAAAVGHYHFVIRAIFRAFSA